MEKICENKRKIGQGSISLTTSIIVAITTVMASAIGAWATSNTKTEVLQERESNHYAEITQKLNQIDKKIDYLSEELITNSR